MSTYVAVINITQVQWELCKLHMDREAGAPSLPAGLNGCCWRVPCDEMVAIGDGRGDRRWHATKVLSGDGATAEDQRRLSLLKYTNTQHDRANMRKRTGGPFLGTSMFGWLALTSKVVHGVACSLWQWGGADRLVGGYTAGDAWAGERCGGAKLKACCTQLTMMFDLWESASDPVVTFVVLA
jgi:hypothetical protein